MAPAASPAVSAGSGYRYPEGVPAVVDVPTIPLPDAIEASVRRWPRRDALRFYGRRWSYQEFWDASGQVAATLHREGFRTGDRLALYLPNCPVYPIAFVGALRLGLTVVQVSPLYQREDLGRLLRDAEPRGIVALDIHWQNIVDVEATSPVPLHIVARLRDLYPWYERPFVNRVARKRGFVPVAARGPKVRDWRSLLEGPDAFPRPALDPAKAVAVLQYTGGTTGVPKAAMLTHRNLLANALQCQSWFAGLVPGTSVLLAAIPFFHVYGMTVALNYPLLSGTTIVLELRPDPNEMLRLIARHRPQELPGVPAIYRALAAHPKIGKYDVRSVKLCISGSAPLPPEVARDFEALTGGSLIEGYGLSEASPVTHANPVDHRLRKAGTVGLPLPSTQQRVVDAETGQRTLPIGEAGELAVRGPQVMLGYYRRPEETAAILRDGWLLTGDIGSIDADGYVTILDRKKDMINVGGLKAYPREIEELLGRHPGIAEAAVIGVPDRELGEVVHAFVVPKPGQTLVEREVIEFVRARLAHFKAPRSVEFCAALPKSGIQKVLRRELRERARAAGPSVPAR
ncbi:MAG: long-chain fatty acid--CoA ligase [Thermoplasmata archaeon]|nr:long-chain fatty acid--CoA ligase [Thermoplasmata archaeon]